MRTFLLLSACPLLLTACLHGPVDAGPSRTPDEVSSFLLATPTASYSKHVEATRSKRASEAILSGSLYFVVILRPVRMHRRAR